MAFVLQMRLLPAAYNTAVVFDPLEVLTTIPHSAAVRDKLIMQCIC